MKPEIHIRRSRISYIFVTFILSIVSFGIIGGGLLYYSGLKTNPCSINQISEIHNSFKIKVFFPKLLQQTPSYGNNKVEYSCSRGAISGNSYIREVIMPNEKDALRIISETRDYIVSKGFFLTSDSDNKIEYSSVRNPSKDQNYTKLSIRKFQNRIYIDWTEFPYEMDAT